MFVTKYTNYFRVLELKTQAWGNLDRLLLFISAACLSIIPLNQVVSAENPLRLNVVVIFADDK